MLAEALDHGVWPDEAKAGDSLPTVVLGRHGRADVEDPDRQGLTLLLHAIDVEQDITAQAAGGLRVDTTAFCWLAGQIPPGAMSSARPRSTWPP